MAALLLAMPAAAAEPDIDVDPVGEIGLLDWGTYTGRDVGAVSAENTVEGMTHRLSDVKLVQRGTEICAGQDTMFGIRYRLTDKAREDHWALVVETRHPMLHAPNGRSGDRGSYVTGVSHESDGYTGWTVRYPYEFVPGDYSFALLHDGVVKLRKTFHVAFDCVPLVS